MKLSAWNNYPVIEGELSTPASYDDISSQIQHGFKGITQGKTKSYGDSALASNVISTNHLNLFISFDESTGILHCQAGITLDEILLVFIPKGWMLPVVPGTKMISVGGAIGSDVHGKNHHSQGSFGEHVIEIRLITADGALVACTRTENTDLFLATCGGMGLTGIICDVKIQMQKATSSYFQLTKYKTNRLEETFKIIEDNLEFPYSVAWLDSLAVGQNFGRSVVEISQPLEDGDLVAHSPAKLVFPFNMPSIAMNKYTMKMLCYMYYNLMNPHNINTTRTHYSAIINVLDVIKNWNRAYGKNGFLQYQFVIPKAAGIEGFAEVLKEISDSGKASFISVLKLCGAQNDHILSFPMEGYSLALDFKLEPSIFSFFEHLDEIVMHHGGRVYLTKDARLSEKNFKIMYPQWEAFTEIRSKYGADKVFNSAQSIRLGL